MATLQKIVIQDFRNIQLQELAFSPNINCISGGNGEGKTNLLDAIWYLSMTKSAFSASDRFNFRYGTSAFALSGTYALPGGTAARFSIRVQDGGQKSVRRDDKPYERISEHIGVLPIVMVSPADTAMVSEAGEERRKFVNAVLSQMEQPYLADVQQYNRLLLQRNKLLKAGITDEALLGTFDERLAALATPIFERRNAFCERLVPVVQQYYAEISGGREQVGVEYRSDLQKGDLQDILRAHRDRDQVLKFTSAGVQRDDFLFTMDGHPIRRCGSQGQQKSFLVALKFAQYEIMKTRWGFPPILLLDDLFDKLDMERAGNLLKMVAGNDFGQIFISDTDKTRTETLLGHISTDRAFFKASSGTFTKIDGDL